MKRLIFAHLPENALQFLARDDWTLGKRMKLAVGMLSAMTQVVSLGIAHCDLKPDSFMLDDECHVFLVNFGSVSAEGDVPPMTCGTYRPPGSVVSLAWDVFSLRKVLGVFDRHRKRRRSSSNAQFSGTQLHALMCKGRISRRPSAQECVALVHHDLWNKV